jgi:hypothetical protein
MIVLSNNYGDDEDEPETNEPVKTSTSRRLLGNMKERQAKKVKARGYALHLPNLLLPLVPLMFLLGGVWSLQREHTRWGVLGCPASDGSMGSCGLATLLSLILHVVAIVLMVLWEFKGGGQANFVRIAKKPDEFTAANRRIREEHVTLQMNGWAGHTTTTGSGKNRSTTTHTTWSGTEDAKYDKDEDFSEAIADKMMRGHSLVCVNLVLQVRYKTKEDEMAVTAQYDTFCEMVRTKDSMTRLSLNPILQSWPEDGKLAVLNGSGSTLWFLSILIPLADVFGWGWSLRMLMEFWTVEATVTIVKEVQAKPVPAAIQPGGPATAAVAATAKIASVVVGKVVGKADDAWAVPSNEVVADNERKSSEAKIPIGACVEILTSPQMWSALVPRVGQRGTLVETDGSQKPFHVRFSDGEKWWFHNVKQCEAGELK